MRLVMLSTGPFAVPTFRKLYETGHEVAALVTGAVRIRRGKPVSAVSPLREIAGQHGTAIFDPQGINTAEARARLAEFRPELLVVCDYGQILSAETLAVAQLGGLNLHGSLLPKYRGAAPVNWAIYHGEQTSGVTVIHMTPKVDAGPCIAQAETPIGPDETAVDLEKRLSQLGAGLMCQAIDAVGGGRIEPLPQEPASASKAPRLKKADGLIDWRRPAAAIRNQVRAFEPWPKTYTFWHRPQGKPVRLILGPVEVVQQGDLPEVRSAVVPGEVLEAAGGRLVIAAGAGAVMPQSIQPAGKRLLDVEEFLRGYRVRQGDRLGPEQRDRE